MIRRRRVSGKKPASQVHTPKGLSVNKAINHSYGDLAQRVIQSAKEAGLFVHEAPDIMNLLMKVDMPELLPEELFISLAEVLIFAQAMEESK